MLTASYDHDSNSNFINSPCCYDYTCRSCRSGFRLQRGRTWWYRSCLLMQSVSSGAAVWIFYQRFYNSISWLLLPTLAIFYLSAGIISWSEQWAYWTVKHRDTDVNLFGCEPGNRITQELTAGLSTRERSVDDLQSMLRLGTEIKTRCVSY